jgi:protein ImuB
MTHSSSPPTRRLLALWLPHLPTDRLARSAADRGAATARVTIAQRHATLELAAVDARTAALGLAPGMALAEARALVPDLVAAPSDALADAKFLSELARWCERYTPLVALDGSDALLLDITGAARLHGGEAALGSDLQRRLARAGFAARIAITGTPAASWALAHFGAGDAPIIVAPHGERAALATLPPAALRLASDIVETLERLGLRRVADLHDLPRGGLMARFGATIAARLDQALGRLAEPISPLAPQAPWRETLAFAEPLLTAEALACATRHLLGVITARLTAAELGARRLELSFLRVDARVERAAIATSAPSRDPDRLAKLLAEKLTSVDPGDGIDAAILAAIVVEPLTPLQLALTPAAREAAASFGPPPAIDLAPLVDRLVNRLGDDAVKRLEPLERHVPEMAQRAVAPLATIVKRDHLKRVGAWTEAPTRPVRLLPAPEPIEVVAPVPDDPPLLFRWRGVAHRIARADGPERIAGEWWRNDRRAARDYYRVEDEHGARFWLFRDGLWSADDAPPRWFLHGFFA